MRLAVSILFLFLFTHLLLGLEVTRGKVRINIDEQKGTVIISVTESLENPRWIPLTWTRDASTTFFSLRFNGQVLNLLPGNQFLLSVSEELNGVRMNYRGVRADVSVLYEFLTTKYSSISDGLRISVEITNKTANEARVDLRYLIDTYLGEPDNHFLIDNVVYNREHRIVGRTAQTWVSSRKENPPRVGLMFWLGDGVTTPTRTLFSNWKRIKDSGWDFIYSENREFNMSPYSFNDSAVAVYYEGLTIQAESRQTVIIAMANASAKDLIGAKVGSESPLADSYESTVIAPEQSNNLLQLLRRDKEVLLDLLRKLNIKMNNPDSVTTEEIEAMNAILRELENRKSLFQ